MKIYQMAKFQILQKGQKIILNLVSRIVIEAKDQLIRRTKTQQKKVKNKLLMVEELTLMYTTMT